MVLSVLLLSSFHVCWVYVHLSTSMPYPCRLLRIRHEDICLVCSGTKWLKSCTSSESLAETPSELINFVSLTSDIIMNQFIYCIPSSIQSFTGNVQMIETLMITTRARQEPRRKRSRRQTAGRTTQIRMTITTKLTIIPQWKDGKSVTTKITAKYFAIR